MVNHLVVAMLRFEIQWKKCQGRSRNSISIIVVLYLTGDRDIYARHRQINKSECCLHKSNERSLEIILDTFAGHILPLTLSILFVYLMYLYRKYRSI